VSPTVSSTFVFADIAGFTALTEAHGDEDAAAPGAVPASDAGYGVAWPGPPWPW
jgi:hypothetical protein